MDKELEKKREFYQAYDLTEEQFAKLEGEPEPGGRISIQWKKYPGEEEFDAIVDEGYAFILPGMDASVCDCYFHIPHPDNSGGIGAAPEEFGYLVELLINELVDKITCS
jgi:hypothetical protein